MSDIVITLDSQSAISNAKALETALDKLEDKAKTVKERIKKFSLHGKLDLKLRRLATDMKAIQSQINKKRLIARVILRVDKRSLRGLQRQVSSLVKTHTGAGQEVMKKMGLTKSPKGVWAAEDKMDRYRDVILNKQAKEMANQEKINSIKRRTLDILKKTNAELMAKPKIKKPRDMADRAIDSAFGQPDQVRDQHAFAKKLKAKTAERRHLEGIQKDLTKLDKMQDKITAKTPKTIQNIQEEYGNLRKSLHALSGAYARGDIDQKTFRKGLGKYKGDLKTVQKEQRKLTKSTGRLSKAFTMVTRAVVLLAGVMFIWQKMRQAMTAVIGVGDEISKIFAKITAETSGTEAQTGALVDRFKEISSGAIWGIPQVYEAYKELRKQGLGANDALKQTIPTLKIARNEDLKLAEAAKMAAHNTLGLRDQYLKLNTELAKTGGDAWKTVKESIKSIFAEIYAKQEPVLIQNLKTLNDYISDNKEAIVAGLSTIAGGIRVLVTGLLAAAAAIAKFLGWLKQLPTGGGGGDELATKRAEINKLIDLWHDAYRQRKQALQRPDFTLGISRVAANEKLVAKYTKIMDDIRNKIIKTQKEIDKLTLVPTLPDKKTWKLEEFLKGHQDLYSKIGMMTREMYTLKSDAIDEWEKDNIDMWKSIKDTAKMELTEIAADIDRMNLKWQQGSKFLKDHAELFRYSGTMSDMYFDQQIQKIRDLEKSYTTLSTSEKKHLTYLKERAVAEKRAAALAAPHKAIFEKTGMMTDEYQEELQRKARARFTYQKEMGVPEEIAAPARAIDIIQIERDKYAKRLEMAGKYFEATGKASHDYMRLQLKDYWNMSQQMIETGAMFPEEAKERYERMAADFKLSLKEPLLNDYRELYSVIGSMVEGHHELELEFLMLRYERLKENLGNSLALWEWYTEKKRELTIQELEGGDTLWEGMQAGMERMAGVNETLSKKVSDDWVSGMKSIQKSWKKLFTDTMKHELNDWKDYARDILTQWRDMFVEILWDMLAEYIKVNMRMKAVGFLGNIMGFGGGGGSVGGATSGRKQHGGWINEPVVGWGQRTGQQYSIAEVEPEYVSPPSKMSKMGPQGGSMTINIPITGIGSAKLEQELRQGIEDTVIEIMQEEMK